jgi:hypothetical protein
MLIPDHRERLRNLEALGTTTNIVAYPTTIDDGEPFSREV